MTVGPGRGTFGALRELADRVGRAVRASFPELTRRVSGYNLDQLLPGRVDLARALVGTEGTCDDAGGHGPARRVAGRARAGDARLPRRLHRGRPRHADPRAAAR